MRRTRASTALRREAAGALVVTLCLVPSPGHAGTTARASAQSYADDDGVSVVTSAVSASTEQGDLRVQAGFLVDVLSAASVDLVSAASPDGFDETRGAFDAGADVRVAPDAWVGASAAASTERDYQSRAAGVRGIVELDERSTTLTLRAGLARDEVGRAGDERFSRERGSWTVELAVTRLLDPLTAIDVGGVAIVQHGYLASPYRLVLLQGGGSVTGLQESVPDRRVRGALEVRVRRRLARGLFGAAEARGHADDWGVAGGSGQLRLSQELVARTLTVTGRVRGYRQGGASFWRRSHEGFPTAPRLRTADKELSPMWSLLGGARVELDLAPKPADRVIVDLGLDVLDLHYTDHPAIERRSATLASAGLEVSFP